MPSETVYGLAANALDASIARRIFEIKGRPLIDPLICHFYSLDAIGQHVHLNDSINKLASVFWPGALTIVAKKKESIPDIVTAGLPSVAIRMPGNEAFRNLLKSVDFPLAAPSANPFGYVSPSRAEQVEQTLGEQIPAILDAGPCEIGIESTIIDLRDEQSPSILRHGPILQEQLSLALGRVVHDRTKEIKQDKKDENEQQLAPGRLHCHYSPNASVYLLENGVINRSVTDKKSALLLNKKPSTPGSEDGTYWLSEDGDLPTIARNLFDMLQKLDRLGYRSIYVERCSNDGIGRAINDRIGRAAAK